MKDAGQESNICTQCSIWANARFEGVHLQSNCIKGRGPLEAEILIVGEAPGADEDSANLPFVGKAGRILSDCLKEAGLDEDSVRITNACRCRPVSRRAGDPSGAVDNRAPSGEELTICASLHLDPEIEMMPNLKVIVPLGNSAYFAVKDRFHYKKPPAKALSRITAVRGRPLESENYEGVTILPSYHPAYILRNPDMRKYLVRDLITAKELIKGKSGAGSATKENYTVIADLDSARKMFSLLRERGVFSWDTETTSSEIAHGQKIIAFTFSVGPRQAFYLPFWEPETSICRVEDIENYWLKHFGEEGYAEVTGLLKSVMEDESIKKIGHNMMFDALFLLVSEGAGGKPLGIEMKNWFCDTMVAHFMLHENEPHDLKTLAQLYTDLGHYEDELDAIYRKVKQKVSKINNVREACRRFITTWRALNRVEGRGIKAINESYGLNIKQKSPPEYIEEAVSFLEKQDLRPLTPHYGMIDRDVLRLYALKDADATFRISLILLKEMRGYNDPDFLNTFFKIRMQMCRRLMQAEACGVHVDEDLINTFSSTFEQKQIELEEFIKKETGNNEINIASTIQLRSLLYGDKENGGLGLDIVGETEKGDPSTNKSTLDKLYAKTGNEVLKAIITWRHLQNLRSTFLEGMKDAINPVTGKVHPKFKVAQAATQRVVCSKPNLLNIPRDEGGDESNSVKIRNIFIPKPPEPEDTVGEYHVFVDGDLSQAELRVFASLSGDRKLKEMLEGGVDIHSYFANIIYKLGVPEDQLHIIKSSPEMKVKRSRTKNMVFGCVTTDCQALTPHGWLYHNEINVGDEVLALDLNNQKWVWTPVLDKVVYQNAALLKVSFYKDEWFIRTTEDHRWPLILGTKIILFAPSSSLPELSSMGYRVVNSIMLPNRESGEQMEYNQKDLFQLSMFLGGGYTVVSGEDTNHSENYLFFKLPSRMHAEIAMSFDGYESPGGFLPKSNRRVSVMSCEDTKKLMELYPVDESRYKFLVTGMSGRSRDDLFNSISSLFLTRGSDEDTLVLDTPNRNPDIDLLAFACGWFIVNGGPYCLISQNTPLDRVKVVPDGTGEVWCVKTEYDTWVTRTPEGMITVTGNTLYGQNEYGAEKTLGIPKEEARTIIDTFFSLCPEGKKWIEQQKMTARREGKVRTPLGVYRHLPELKVSDQDRALISEAERIAVNSPIQTHASDYNCMAFLDICNDLDELGIYYEPKVIIYDSIIIECKLKDALTVKKIMEKRMTQDRKGYDVKMDCDVGIYDRWSGKSIDVESSLKENKLIYR